ncbi:MAG: pyridoxamine 5'-phosphate oxidase family protein [Sulfurimonas sp.]|uniref:pyridoxamine 5'-phosphate oxidase family protein n=1 Tax=Sulfurimonas sp. TaxID=2022749 RepID=UPI0025E9B9BF|nr:pyridoxamine 5'-phosphate oxidase family protein [Sulfurimonas sp.]MCK9491666.1 pyridoxamine 5'-phosphate oxidase family protein [Sulfurimonas sp.]
MSDLEKIESFIDKHHVLSLATSDGDELSVCSLFYVYEDQCFVVASSDDTTHIKHILKNQKVAGNILLETKEVGKIQGVQFQGSFTMLEDKNLKKLYFKKFPYAIAMRAKLWEIKVSYFKLTDNRLGFGKKIIWQES